MIKRILKKIFSLKLVDLKEICDSFYKRRKLHKFIEELNWSGDLKIDINDDWSLDIEGYVLITESTLRGYKRLPFKINKVIGTLSLHNPKMEVIDNLPEFIDGSFLFYSDSNLEKVEFPKRITGSMHLKGVLPEDTSELPIVECRNFCSVAIDELNIKNLGSEKYRHCSDGLHIIQDYDKVKQDFNNKVKLKKRSERICKIIK